MAQFRDSELKRFLKRMRGAVLRPGDAGYEEARALWNARIDRRPALIARCRGTADVMTAVRFARERGLPLSVKGGGHHVSGAAVCDDGVAIDLAPMDGVRVDPSARTARVQAGARWADVDQETQAFGLAVPGGQDPNIGVAGLALGGGIGWLSRKHGLTSDNLLAADVVTADGELVQASEEVNADLFWGIRGGGGNFGIVTSFKFRLHEVGPEILAGSLIHKLEDAPAVARRYRAFMEDAPDEARIIWGIMQLPAIASFPEAIHHARVAILIACYVGDPDDGEAILAPLRAFGPPIADSIHRRSYRAFQRAGRSAPTARTYLRSQYLDPLSDGAIETIAAYGADAPSPGATVFVSPRGGAETRPPSDATAYAHRTPAHHLLIEARWDDPAGDEAHIAWVRAFQEAIHPATTGDVAMNFMTHDESPDRAKAAYGTNYDRLVALKTKWDPDNVFRTTPTIQPAPTR